jgi:primosomal protein N' (replication factor Y)
MTAPVAEILLPLALDQTYSYAVPPDLSLAEGDVVEVPLGTKRSLGVVWALREGAGANLKAVAAKIATPPLSPALRRLVDWLSWYTLAPKGFGAGPGAARHAGHDDRDRASRRTAGRAASPNA